MLQRLALTFALALTSIGCLVNVTHVSNPDRYFDEARRLAASVAGKEGPARELRVLVYEPDENKLVRVEVPIGLVRHLAKDNEFDFDFDDDDFCGRPSRGCKEARKRLRKFSGRDLDKLPLGILVEVSEDDGERVLVYLR